MFLPIWLDLGMLITLALALFIATTQPKISETNILFTAFIAIFAIFQFGFAPATEFVGSDRPNYAYMFSHADEMYNWGFRDAGFTYYLKLCDILTGSATGGFFISAIIYVLAYVYFYSKSFNKYVLYVLLLSFLSLGFTNHYYNVLRAGLSISFVLIAISKDQKKSITIIFSLLALSFHISSLLMIVGYIVTKYIRNTKLLYGLWIVMLSALLAGFFDSFQQYIELFANVEDDRLDVYLSGNDYGYKVGLRLDFIAYSLFPILIGAYYIYKCKYKDLYYTHIYNLYILTNACWLIFSKMHHNDRMAYLSWCLIPFILLYPIFNSTTNTIKHKKVCLCFLTLIIVGVNFYLKYFR